MTSIPILFRHLPALPLLVPMVLFMAGTPGHAVTIHATKTTDDKPLATCKAGSYKDCKSSASLDKATSLKGNDAGFDAAFKTWNNGNAANQKWTLKDGGNLPGGEFTVSSFAATASDGLGGLSIIVDWSYSGADKADYLWSQGLSINYTPGSNAAPANTPSAALDTDRFNSLNACNNKDTATSWSATRTMSNYYCGPAYPYQTGERQLGDAPQGLWPNASFEAYAFVSKIDRNTRTLTIYEGLKYGFVLSATAVPETGAAAMALAGLAVLGLAGRRGNAARA